MSRLGKNLALLATSVVLTLLVAELGLRLVVGHRVRRNELRSMLDRSRDTRPEPGTENVSLRGLIQASSNDRIVYELKPGLEATFIGVPVSINGSGFREREMPRAKPAGTFRVLGLGDSQMFGWGVPVEESYLRVLERLLARRDDGVRYEVLNFAVPGYNAAMEVEAYRAAARGYQGDLVVVGYMGNDDDIPGFMKTSVLPWPSSSYVFNLFVHGSAVMRQRAQELMPTHRDADANRLVAPGGVPEVYLDMVGPEAVYRAYRDLASMTAPRGIPVLVFGDAFVSLGREQIAELEREWCFHFLSEKAVRRGYERRHRLVLEPSDLTLSAEDPHASPLGHRMRGEGIYHALVKRRLLGGRSARGRCPPA